MKTTKFTSFISEFSEEREFNRVLNEALDSPIEFYMTDDTNMPEEIYSAFKIEDRDYGMSLVKSQWNGVFILDFYHIKNKYKKKWAVKQSGDIVKALSTVNKFFEACQPFLGTKMKGVIMQLPDAKDSLRYIKTLKRVIKKSHIKSYREVPITKVSDKARNYLFLIKKNIAPEQLFKSVTFSKHFVFDTKSSEMGMDSEAMDIAAEPKKFQPKTVSLTPEPVMTFGKLPVEMAAGEKLMSVLDAAVEKFNQENNPPEETEDNKVQEILYVDEDSDKIRKEPGAAWIPISHIFSILLPKAVENIKNFGFDASKISIHIMNYVVSENISKLPKSIIKSLIDKGYFNESGDGFNFDAKEKIINVLANKIGKIKQSDLLLSTVKLNKHINIENGSITLDNVSKVKYDTPKSLDLEVYPVSTLEPFEKSNTSTPNKGYLGFEEDPENVDAKISVINQMSGVKKWIESVNWKEPDIRTKNLLRYTGSAAAPTNIRLRETFKKGKTVNYDDLDNYIKSLMEYFESDAPTLEESLWVYRNADLPQEYDVGENIVDAAFLSTSVGSTMSYGSYGNARMKIYLPKGTKCFPILNYSKNPGESEIVIPNLSVIKVIERVDVGKKMYYTGILLGTGNKSLIESKGQSILLEDFEQQETQEKNQENIMNEQNEQNEKMSPRSIKIEKERQKIIKELGYDPADKYGAEISSKELSKGFMKLVKDGKMKIRN